MGLEPISKEFEKAVNKEEIEQAQELVIEEEENVPAYQLPAEKYSNTRTSRGMKPELKILAPVLHLKSQLGVWFKVGKRPIGLKGGADSERPAKRRHVIHQDVIDY